MQKSEWTISFIFFTAIYVLTSFSSLSITVFADNHTNMSNGTHLECVNQACAPVNNTLNNTVDLCTSNTQCINNTPDNLIQAVRANRTITFNLTHLACINQACVPVSGTGFDLCTNNDNCTNMTNTTHLACVNRACTWINNTINGTNIDECLINFDCENRTGGGNGSDNGSGRGGGGRGSEFLPLAPPIAELPPARQPNTLFRIITQFARRITGLFAAN
ncbi:MAG TPA: hypothetical protein VJH37_00475 [Candidatus Nanoarchaeia archaeon]|nr:hypothetical protein [Candidatus Nanoarchaeia archaeon]